MPVHSSPERIVWRRLDDGDYRKFAATSNDSNTGGGARDLRFRNWNVFEPILGEMFLGRQPNSGPRKVTVFTGTVAWMEVGTVVRKQGEVWPPTDSRPGEGRLATVQEFGPFATAQRFPGEIELVVLVQDSDQEIWPYVIGHTQLQYWDERISKSILDCLHRPDRPDHTLAAGYFDMLTGKQKCVV